MTHLPRNLITSLLAAAAFVSVPAFASTTSAQPQCGDEKGGTKDGTKDGKTGDSKDGTKDGKAGDTKPKAPSAH